MVKIVEMGGLIEKIAGDQDHHLRRPAVVIPQVNDESIATGEEVHGGNRGMGAILRLVKCGEFQVADIREEMTVFSRSSPSRVAKISPSVIPCRPASD